MAFDPNAYMKSEGITKSAKDSKGAFNPDEYLSSVASEKEPYYNPVEKKLISAGQYVAESKVGKGLKAIDDKVTNPIRGKIMDAMGVEDSDPSDDYRSFKDLMTHEEGILPTTKASEIAPSWFSEDPDEYQKALTFKKGGWLDQSPGSLMGNVADVTLDPINAVPVMGAAKVGVKGLKKASGALGLPPKAAALKASAKDLVKKGYSKVGSNLTGMSEDSIRNYIDNTGDINNLIKKTGDSTEALSTSVDDLKSSWNKRITAAKRSRSKAIENSLDVEGANFGYNLDSLQGDILEMGAKLDPVTQAEDLKHLTQIWNEVAALSNRGDISATATHKLKEHLQDRAKGAYLQSGQVIKSPREGARLAKNLARKVRKDLNAGVPGQAKANNELSYLHTIQDSMNRNLLKEGVSENAVFSAGRGSSGRNMKTLRKLGEFTDSDMLGDAKNLATAKDFANPPLLPVDATGKSLTRLIPAVLAYAAFGRKGAIAVGMLTSPMALKASINAGRMTWDMVAKVTGSAAQTMDNLGSFAKHMDSPSGQFKAYTVMKDLTGRTARVQSIKGGIPDLVADEQEPIFNEDEEQLFKSNPPSPSQRPMKAQAEAGATVTREYSPFIEKMKDKPYLLEQIKDPRLKKMVGDFLEDDNGSGFLKSKVDEKEAREQYLEGN